MWVGGGGVCGWVGVGRSGVVKVSSYIVLYKMSFTNRLPQSLPTILLLTLVGTALNLIKLPLFYGIDFLFGGIFVMLVALRYGALWAFVSALVVYTTTYLHCNHFYDVPMFALEALFVGWRYNSKRGNLIIHDLVFWFLPGIPVAFGTFIYVIGFSMETAITLWLKCIVNGSLYSLLASLLFHVYQQLRYHYGHSFRAISLRNMLFETMAVIVIVPSFIVGQVIFNRYWDDREELYQRFTHLSAMAVMNHIGVQKGNMESVLEVTPLIKSLEGHLTLIDPKGDVINSTYEPFTRQVNLRGLLASGQMRELSGGVTLWLPKKAAHVPHRLRWDQAFYFKEVLLPNGTIIVHTPLMPAARVIGHGAVLFLAFMAVLIILSVATSHLISRYIASSVDYLSDRTTHLPEQIERGEEVSLRPAFIREINQLVLNFREVIGQIGRYISEIKNQRDLLEDRVQERTLALQQSEHKYRTLAENLLDVVYRIRLRPKITLEFINGRIEDLTGFSPEQLYRNINLIFIIIHPEDRHKLRSFVTMRGQQQKTITLRWVSKTGKTLWIEHSNNYTYDEKGRLIAIEGTGRDVTNRRLLAELFRESAKRFQILFNNAPDAIFIADIETGLIVDLNLAAESLMNADRSGLIGKHFYELHPPEMALEVKERFPLYATQEEHYIEAEVLRSDGVKVPVEIIANVIEIQGRKALCGIYRDISRRKQAEAALRQALEEKDLLIREVHHRVKNNLQVIMSLINIKLNTPDIGDVNKSILLDLKQRIKAMSLVHESLYLSENLSHISISNYMAELIRQVVSTYGRKGIEISQDIDNIDISFEAAIQIGLIINELLSNAYKHAFPDKREGRIMVRLKRLEGDRCSLTVADDGIGIKDVSEINSRGSLGMQLVYLIASKLEAKIDIQSARGTTVVIEFHCRHKGD